MTEGLNASDVALLSGRNGDGWGGDGMGSWWIIIFLIFAFMGGFGNNGGNTLTQQELQAGFNNQAVIGKLDRLGDGISSLGYDQLGQINGLQRDMCTGFSSVAAAIEQTRFDAKSCCCETNRNIDSIRYENAQNTCAITSAIHAEGEQIRALITANEMQTLRDQLAEARLANNQCAQNAYLVNTLRPTPIPAYQSLSPYESAYFGRYGNNGCGCA